MATLYAGWTETQEQANARWEWRKQRELCNSIVTAAKPVMDAMLATITLIDEPHPADVAYDIEALPESEQVAAEVAEDSRWLDSASVSESWQAEAEAEHADWLDAKSTEENARM